MPRMVFEDTPLTELATTLVANPGKWARVISGVNHATASAVATALSEAVTLQGFTGVEVSLQPKAVLWGVWARFNPARDHVVPVVVPTPGDRRRPEPTPPATPREVRPTAIQQAAIDALNAANAAKTERDSKQRTSSGSCAVPTSGMAKYLRPVAKAAVAAGWDIVVQGNGHLCWRGPGGARVVTPLTGHVNGAAPRNVLAQLRRAGAPV